MKTVELESALKINQKVQLVKGDFTPSEAFEIINTLIEDKINFHKLQRLQLWEEDHRFETDQIDNRIKELKEERRIFKEFIATTREKGKKLKINGVLDITLAE